MRDSEASTLDAVAHQWVARGYTIRREPAKSELPDFFGNYRPDAIAVGQSPSLAIAVVNPLLASTTTKLQQIQRLFNGRDDWKLEVVYFASDFDPVQTISDDHLFHALQEARVVVNTSTKAAFLLAWAGLEAAARPLYQRNNERQLSPKSLVDLLISLGLVDQEEGTELRGYAKIRTQIIHGQLDLEPTAEDVIRIADVAEAIATSK